MKKRRGFFNIAVVSILCVFFALFSPSFFMRFISTFFLAALLLSFLYITLIPRCIKVRYRDSAVRGIKHKNLHIRLEVKNTSPLPIPYFTLTNQTGELFTENRSKIVSLRPFETKTLIFQCRGHNRGGYFVGPVQLAGHDPFGFLNWKTRADIALRVIVYPSIHRLHIPNTAGLPAGNISIQNKIYEDLTRFRSLREYSPGDDIRRINWKASARTNKLYSMEFDPALYFPVLIALNFSLDDYPSRNRDSLLERAAETAASAAFYFSGVKQEIGLATSGAVLDRHGREESSARIKNGFGDEHVREILKIISMLQPVKGSAAFNEMLFGKGASISMGTFVVVISPRLKEEQLAVLLAAQRRGVNINLVKLESGAQPGEARGESGLPAVTVREIEG